MNIPKVPYITIESLVKDKNGYDSVFIIKPNASKNIFKLGRGLEADIRIGDISVSRAHSEIKFENNNFSIVDNTSKFGSLKLIRESHKIKLSTFQYFKVGRTLIKIYIDLPTTILPLIPPKEFPKFSEWNMKLGKSPIIMNKLKKNKGDEKVEDLDQFE